MAVDDKKDSNSRAELLLKYKQTGDKSLRNEVVLAYMSIVNYAAVSTRNMYQKYIETDDVINEATIALIGSIETFDVSRNVKFETYASLKVRGAIIDFIRRQDVVSRGVRKFAKDYDNAYSELYSSLKREPTEKEIAEKLFISTDKLQSGIAQAAAAQTLSFEELVVNTGFDIGDQMTEDGVWSTEEELYKKEKLQKLAESIKALSEKERLVITLYYFEKLRFADIGKVLDVSESRVCQIHTKAVSKMKDFMAEYMGLKTKTVSHKTPQLAER